MKSAKGKTIVEPKLIQILTDTHFAALPRELVGIVGQVGSGKSSLLLSLLGDMERWSGDESRLHASQDLSRSHMLL